MLDTLTARLTRSSSRSAGEARLTEANIQDALREVRVALLEADVALAVVKHFVDSVRAKALGAEVVAASRPDRRSSAWCTASSLRSWARPMSGSTSRRSRRRSIDGGLAGLGQDHHAGKLARLLAAEKKRFAVVSADVYRPRRSSS